MRKEFAPFRDTDQFPLAHIHPPHGSKRAVVVCNACELSAEQCLAFADWLVQAAEEVDDLNASFPRDQS